VPSGVGSVAVGGDPVAQDLLDQAMQGQHGGDHKSEEFNVDNVNIDRPDGTSQSQGLRRGMCCRGRQHILIQPKVLPKLTSRPPTLSLLCQGKSHGSGAKVETDT